MPSPPPRRRRARPVADAPIDGLLLRTPELAKAWLLALVEQAALQSAPLLAGAGVVDEGPELCDAVLRALADDLELWRLEPDAPLGGLAARTGELAGAGGNPAATAQAVDALEGVLWAALREELPAPDSDLISDLAQRLGLVSGLLRWLRCPIAHATERLLGDQRVGRETASMVATPSIPSTWAVAAVRSQSRPAT